MLVVVLLGLLGTPAPAAGQDAFSMSVASDILFPVSNFGEAYNTGFGGNIQGRIAAGSAVQLGVTTGFFSWAAKDGRGVSDFRGIPVRGLVKLNFAAPMYLLLEGGAFIGWYTGASGGASTDFNYSIGFGAEPPLSKDGDIRMDASLRYEGVARDNFPVNNIVLRVGVTFAVIQ